MSKYFIQLSNQIDRLYRFPNDLLASKIADKICWCHQWKKITEEETDLLCDRMTKFFQNF